MDNALQKTRSEQKNEFRRFFRHSGVMGTLFTCLKYTLLVFTALIIILPILVVFFGAFKTGAEFNSTGAFELPQRWALDNFITVWQKGNMGLAFWNTFVMIVLASAGSIMTGTMASYVLHRFDFRGKELIRHLFLWIVLIPGTTAQVARFQIINALHLYNTMATPIILAMGTDIMAIYIYLQFLESISKSLDESAILDGAGYFRVYFQIIMPLLKPATVTVLIIKSIGLYNDFYTPFLYMPKKSLTVISTVLYKFKGPFGSQWELICAGIVIALVPTLIIFIVLQKQIYNGMVSGSVKQ
ncbi:carbohydrate ABC transporter permease [Treponema brennaborense]|uniref:ABC-type transporter, integral membrane subunit n=1 Tax=Treponema brennaborense (strain DSM 12168 / CIP 105900 / DD5/3) TaxID=906968 RepID=F4LJ94_TREBD|nr:carbohydrate ABC transporter permease [Treponema brennaborense]AEE17339.1 ABC-type transporter, integral membrane subunit [Treponema brennaborense DSM 12168]